MKNRHFHYTDRLLSQYQNNSKKCFSHVYRPLLFGAVFFLTSFICSSLYAQLNIAIVDTGFCPNKITPKSTKQKILDVQDMTGSVKIDCNLITDKQLNESGRFHGHHVLKEFLEHLLPSVEISIAPLIIYDNKGNQTVDAWKNSLKYMSKEKFDLVLTASGLVNGSKLSEELPSIWFIPSGRVEKFITLHTSLFPQNLAPKTNIIMIGDFFDGKNTYYDQGLKYQKHIDYYFASGEKGLTGTSKAVAEAMAKAINLCFEKNEKVSANNLRKCLVGREKVLKDPVLKREFKTY